MSKIKVIEVFEGTQMIVQIGTDTKGRVETVTVSVDDLETLNSNYINEHFSELQDTAYQRGLEDGRNETWEAAKKISLMPPDEIEKVFPGAAKYNRYNLGYSAAEAIDKLKAYEEKQKAEDDIKLGDGLEHTARGGCTSKAIFLEQIGYYDEDWYRCLFWTGCEFTILCYPKSQFKRTGKHYDIEKILEEMRHD